MTTGELDGKRFLVTGASSGLGRAMVEALAARGGAVVLAGRSEARTVAVIEGIRALYPTTDLDLLVLDVSDLNSVRRAAEAVVASGRPVDVVVNNAGVAGTRGLTADGFDPTYATNHIGPFLLTESLRPVLERAPQGRVVNVSSVAHQQVRRIDWSLLERRAVGRRARFGDYAVTKLMNILHAKELARRLADTRVTTYALHPGVVASNIWRELPTPLQWVAKRFMLSNEEGAQTQLFCATAPELAGASGRYYAKCRESACSRLAEDESLARELWERTERAIAGQRST